MPVSHLYELSFPLVWASLPSLCAHLPTCVGLIIPPVWALLGLGPLHWCNKNIYDKGHDISLDWMNAKVYNHDNGSQRKHDGMASKFGSIQILFWFWMH